MVWCASGSVLGVLCVALLALWGAHAQHGEFNFAKTYFFSTKKYFRWLLEPGCSAEPEGVTHQVRCSSREVIIRESFLFFNQKTFYFEKFSWLFFNFPRENSQNLTVWFHLLKKNLLNFTLLSHFLVFSIHLNASNPAFKRTFFLSTGHRSLIFQHPSFHLCLLGI